MGWGSYLLLGDLGQQLDIMQQRDEMERLRAAVAEAKSAPAPSGDTERIAQLLNAHPRTLAYWIGTPATAAASLTNASSASDAAPRNPWFRWSTVTSANGFNAESRKIESAPPETATPARFPRDSML